MVFRTRRRRAVFPVDVSPPLDDGTAGAEAARAGGKGTARRRLGVRVFNLEAMPDAV